MSGLRRRDFFRRLGQAATVGAAASGGVALAGTPRVEVHKEWQLRWTGYKPCQESDWMMGQWIAVHPPTGRYAYWSTGGIGGGYVPGAVFSTMVRDGWPFLTLGSPEEAQLQACANAYRCLIDFLETHDRPGVRWPVSG